MDNCFNGRGDRSRQTTEKSSCIYTAGRTGHEVCIRQVSICAYFGLDRMTSSRLFHLAHGVCGRVFVEEGNVKNF